ncbi:5-formyltetrahydrofolate cyclo-ligase [Hypnocyclicus thermotrophus]|uniref:5-formyltetrahydrofolate cyclo-ligase n=1 Tax=Hypnocyclicus thermotrophus TaxID=1627895 RepID=A0AA46I4Z2_9FUSO|nr:5-formyltetrahydrofolate cyclo-ligase [Hypnocyclicus thermotrophus]TDT67848.1 5-formyltetrahydrofolate cyclo-ligase [Hypnocyclicus thermotrophus]
MKNKNEIRKSIKNKREKLDKNYIELYSKELTQIFINSSLYKNAKTIMSYIPIKNEVNTIYINQEIIKDNKTLLLPAIINDKVYPKLYNDNFIKGKYDIKEPSGDIFIDEIDLIIVPGIAFDKYKNRIGFGKGYYDKFLQKYLSSIKVSLIYPFQLVEKINNEKHDIKIDFIFDNNHII